MRPWQRLWFVLTILWGALMALLVFGLIGASGWTYPPPLIWLITTGIPSVVVYLLFWAIAGFFPSRK
jgi:hypothetical protein